MSNTDRAFTALDPAEVYRDSPMLRDRVRQARKASEKLRASVAAVTKAAERVADASTKHTSALRGFSGELLRALPGNGSGAGAGRSIQVEAGFNGAVSAIAAALDDIAGFGDALASQLVDVFVEPMTGVMAKADAVSKEGAKSWSSRVSALDTAVAKYSKVSRNASSVDAARAKRDVDIAKHNFTSHGVQHVEALNDVAASKHFDVLERLLALLFSFSAYFNRGQQYMDELAPMMSELSSQLQNDRLVFEAEKASMREALSDAIIAEAQGMDPSAGNTRPGTPKTPRPAGPADNPATPGFASVVAFEGYLFKQSSSFLRDWKRRYFAISDGQFVYYKKNDSNPIHAVNTLLCSVRLPDAAATDRRSCFEVITPQRSYLLQAEDDSTRDDWIAAIQAATAQQLHQESPGGATAAAGRPDAASAPGATGDSVTGLASPSSGPNNDQILTLWDADPGNRVCSECGSPHPKWVSLNLGTIFCIECSGTHRSLGTHISKVRSLELDALDVLSLHVLCALGNSPAAAAWEADAAALTGIKDDAVVDPAASRAFILAKYTNKAYSGRVTGDVPASHMLTAIADNDAAAVCECLASPNALALLNDLHEVPDSVAQPAGIPPGTQVRPIHLAIALNRIWIVEFLLLNSVSPDATDARGWAPLHYTAVNDGGGLAGLLIKRGADLEPINDDGQTPLDLALLHESANTSTLIRFAKMSQLDSDTSFLSPDSPFMLTWNTLIAEACAAAPLPSKTTTSSRPKASSVSSASSAGRRRRRRRRRSKMAAAAAQAKLEDEAPLSPTGTGTRARTSNPFVDLSDDDNGDGDGDSPSGAAHRNDTDDSFFSMSDTGENDDAQ